MRNENFIKENNGRQFWQPMTHPAEAQAKPPKIITGASGVRIRDIDGFEAIDAVGGLWNVNLGYSNEPIKAAISQQLDTLPYYSTFRGTTNDASIELAFNLCEFFAPEGVERVFYTSGGSDSIETALRLARQYHKLRGDPGRIKFLSVKKGYHGTHMGAASVNGNAKFRNAYEPLLAGCHHIPAPYTYRNPFNETDPARLAQLCLAALEDEIAFQGANTIAAFVMEPILGAGGVIPPHSSFMPGVREICDRNGILLISDEVICAFGRTGAWSGSRLWGVQPDMMCVAKAITNGYFPFGATLINGKIAEVFEADTSGMGAISHGYTYSGHPVGAAAAIVCLEETQKANIKDNAAARGTQLFAGLQVLMTKHDLIGDIRGGHGLMAAIEVVSDRATKKPAGGDVMTKVFDAAYENGVMLRVSGNSIIISPPLIVTAQDVDDIIAALDAGFVAAA